MLLTTISTMAAAKFFCYAIGALLVTDAVCIAINGDSSNSSNSSSSESSKDEKPNDYEYTFYKYAHISIEAQKEALRRECYNEIEIEYLTRPNTQYWNAKRIQEEAQKRGKELWPY